MIKILAGVGLMALMALLAYAASRPDTFDIRRSTRILAGPDQIHPLINELSRFNTWNPFTRKDPAIELTYCGPASGPGAAFEFKGNKDVGSGRITITASRPDQVEMTLDMHSPMKAHNAITFTLKPQGQATEVSWAMHGANPFIGKLIGVVFNMDAMIGRDFEHGLAALKALAESKH